MPVLRLVLAALLGAGAFAQSGGQLNVWMQHGPEGGTVGRPVIDPQNPGTLYLPGPTRYFKTTDSAAHWSEFHTDQEVIAVDPQDSNTLYGPLGYKSTDGGVTWSKTGAGLACPSSSQSFAIDPGNTSTLYAGCQGNVQNGGGGVFKSTDGGATWNAASSGLPAFQAFPTEPWPASTPVNALAIDPVHPNTLYAAIGLTVSYGGGLFQSTDGAASWSAVNGGLPDYLYIDSAAVDPLNPDTLYVAGDAGVFRSTDGAASWTRAGSVLNVRSLAVDPLNAGTVYALNDRGILKSSDGGASWSVVSTDVAGSRDPYPWLVVAAGAGGESTVYSGGNARGAFKSSDGGSTWALANTGLSATWLDSLAIDPQNPRTLYAGAESGLFKTSDGARSWTAAPAVQGIPFWLAIDPQNSGIVYAATPDSVQKSLDGGQSWMELQLPSDSDSQYFWGLAIDGQNPGTLYASNFKSMDGGASWAKLAGFPGFISALAVDPHNSGTIYAGSATGGEDAEAVSISSGVLESVDGGQTWTGMNTTWRLVTVSRVVVDSAHSGVVYAVTSLLDCYSYLCDGIDWTSVDASKLAGAYRSGDGGASWAKLELPGDPNSGLVGIDQQGSVYVWAWSPYTLFRSQDGGVTWNAMPTTGLPPLSISVLAFDPQDANHLFAGTGGAGVFEIKLAQQK